MALLQELLHVLGGGAARASLKHAAASEQGHDRKHLRRSAELENRKQIGEVVAEDVAGDRDHVFSFPRNFKGFLHGQCWRHDPQVQALRVVELQVFLNLRDHVGVVRAVLVQPEDGGRARSFCSVHRELHPVLDRLVLRLAHAPDVALVHVVLEHGFLRGFQNHLHLARVGNLERLVVGPVLFSLGSHQPDVGGGAHLRHVQFAVCFAVVDDCLVDPCVRAVRNDEFGVHQLVVLVPHPSAVPHGGRHARVHDHVGRHVQVRDALVRVDVRDLGAFLVHRVDVGLDLRLFRVAGDLRVHVPQPVVHVHLQLIEKQVPMLREHVLVIHLHRVSEHDGVGDLHHRRLQVERPDSTGFRRVQGLLDHLVEVLHRHARAVDDLVGQKGSLVLQNGGGTIRPLQHDLHAVRVTPVHKALLA
mmetsp:Transcript_26250/g.66180  ORF Transcript_26250/g.66180 Transcript_26250/m.66180 type:complete len:416 (+) Transcript_26250:1613-2860(+)